MKTADELARREFLRRSAAGLGLGLIAGEQGLYPLLARAVEARGGGLLAPRPPHFEPRAKQLIVVFLTGGFSHVDTFDYKPKLAKDEGKTVSAVHLRGTDTLPLMGSPFQFSPCGQSGLMISEIFPKLGTVADELCVIRTLHTDIVEHFQATLAMHTGSATVPMPSLGSWLSYGLGTFNSNLPSYLVLCDRVPFAGSQVWDSNFLPPLHQGVRVVPGPEPIPDLRSNTRCATLQELEQLMLRDLNEMHAAARPDDLDLRARTATYDTARGLMREAPEVFDIARESAATLEIYGVEKGDRSSFGYQCLLARRLIERGVRVIELIDNGEAGNWDSHGNIHDHRPRAQRIDQALAALILDLKRRGLLDQTLLACCTEFGRTPWTDQPKTKGRNHYAKAFSCLLAGAGVKGGTTFGETDEYGIEIVAHPVHVHDYHATILHLMGIDHQQLTYRYAGRDFRLSDVDGKVVTGVLS
jgi:hypothetical protein